METKLIETYFNCKSSQKLWVANGDDAAVMPPLPNGHGLVAATDSLIADVHFPKDMAPELIAEKCVAVNVSDFAAMAATPRYALLSLTLPEVDDAWLKPFSTALIASLNKYNIDLVGGDTVKGPLNIGLSIFGSVAPNSVLRRSGACAGDILAVTGFLGDSALSLHTGLKSDSLIEQYLFKRYYSPTPRLKESHCLSSLITSAIDISDGLIKDCAQLLRMEQSLSLGAEINLGFIPLSSEFKQLAKLKNLSLDIINKLKSESGDDYEILMTVSQDNWDLLQSKAREHQFNITQVGKITDTGKILCLQDEGVIKSYSLSEALCAGYQHYG